MGLSVFPEDVSVFGHKVDELFYLALLLVVLTFILVVGILIYFSIRYRSRPGHKAYYTHGKSLMAVLLTGSLAMSVFLIIDVHLAIRDHFAWEELLGKPVAKDALRVEVMPEQFAWNICYAGPDGVFGTEDDILTLNQLYIPTGRDVVLALRSKDVIHSFFLPNLRVKQDALPGLVTYLQFQAAKTGSYNIACAQHCGLGHYRMKGELIIQPPEEFKDWLSKQKSDPAVKSWGWNWEIK